VTTVDVRGVSSLHAEPWPDRPSFEAVYAAELDYVWRSLRRLGARAADLEDLAHEVFLVVHRRLGDYDPSRPMRPWLFGITLRVAAAGRRRAGRDAPSRDGAPAELADPGPGAEAELEAREARDLLLAALARVPLEQRAVVVLHDLDGLAAPDIAVALELPPNTVYSRLRLGREKLAAAVKRLRARGGDHE
jgi:RNA polymerase sigma-70 factor (ECF subfamily)